MRQRRANGAARHSILAAACAVFVLLGGTAPSWAQDSAIMRHKPAEPESSASADEQLLEGLAKAKKNGEGLVIVGAGFDHRGCNGLDIVIRRRFEPKAEDVTLRATSTFFGSVRNFAPKGLAADTWMIKGIVCILERGVQIFNGPYASFDVRPGEIVDAGFLTIKYQPDEKKPSDSIFTRIWTGTIRLSVGATPEFRLAELRKRIPRVMALAKKEPMELLGPAEQKVKSKPASLF